MAKDWKEMASRLRANQEKNQKNFFMQNEKSDRRIQQLNELQNSMNHAFKAGKGRR